MTTTNPREEKGKQIVSTDGLTRIGNNLYHVKSQTTHKEYKVIKTNDKWICNCPDHTFRQVCCKHIHAVEFSIKIREEVKEKTKLVINPVNVDSCIYCLSNNISKDGLRHNKYGDIQKFQCKDC